MSGINFIIAAAFPCNYYKKFRINKSKGNFNFTDLLVTETFHCASLALAKRSFSHYKKCINFTAQHGFVVFFNYYHTHKMFWRSRNVVCIVKCTVLNFAMHMKYDAFEYQKNELSVAMQPHKVQ